MYIACFMALLLEKDGSFFQKGRDSGFSDSCDSGEDLGAFLDSKGENLPGSLLGCILGVLSRSALSFTELLVAVQAEVIAQRKGNDVV